MEEKLATTRTRDEQLVMNLYEHLLESWNNRDANGFADLFMQDGFTIGFDGTQSNGKKEIQQHLSAVFADHQTAEYVNIIRKIYSIGPAIWVLRADVGMIPPQQHQINPKLNAIQTIVAVKTNGDFRIAMLQNTPAAFHGRPEASEQLTKELTQQHGRS